MSPEPAQRRSRRGPVIILCASAAALLTWSGTAAWVTFVDRDPAALAAEVRVAGRSVSGALAVVPLAAVVLCIAAVISSRALVRVTSVVAGLTAAGALGHGAARLLPPGALRALHSGLAVGDDAAARIHLPAIAGGAIGLVLLIAAGVAAARDVPNWQAMSSRYQRTSHQAQPLATAQDASTPGSSGTLDPAAAWAALDAGDDPTADTSQV